MGVPGSVNNLLGAGGAPQYKIERSLRFNSSDSAYLSRTPASAGNRRTWTWAGWVKLAQPEYSSYFFTGTSGASSISTNGTQIRLYYLNAAYSFLSSSVFRDPSAWYHIVAVCDTTDATSSERLRLYVNGARQSGTLNAPTLNQTDGYINAAAAHAIGSNIAGTAYANCYLADIYFIDGQALTPSSFTEVSATTGQLIPKAYTGTFTGNSFWLKFADNSAATATTLGKDSSGLGNNWTPNNLSVTAGAGNDSLVDTPTSYGTGNSGGDVRGNYCTFNPLVTGKTFTKTLSNGNLDASITASTIEGDAVFSTFQVSSGKWYMEFTPTNVGAGTGTFGIGMMRTRDVQSLANSYGHMGDTQYGYGWNNRGDIYNNGVASAVSSSYVANDVLMLAVDFGGGKLWFGKNGTWLNSGNPAAGTGAIYTNVSSTEIVAFGMSMAAGIATTISCTANWGARPFAYTAPSGFKALCDTSLPAPTIAKGSSAMDVVTYTGTGATLTPTTSLNFSPDLVWIKSRSAATDNALYDSVRGVQLRLRSNTTGAEVTTDSNGLSSFNSNGFTIGALASINTNAATYVAWCWDKAAANGFDIVTYTGNGVNRTIAHSLGVAPSFMIIKQRTAFSTTNWVVWHSNLANTDVLFLNSTAAKSTSATYWNSTSPTSANFSLGTTSSVNANAGTYVAYLWAPVAGYSAFGSYTGNGSADGVFQWCGFRPRWILIKSSSNAEDWKLYDTARDSYNLATAKLYSNLSVAENGSVGETSSTNTIDFLSNGFKLRSSNSGTNTATYVWAAFAESPFQYARAR